MNQIDPNINSEYNNDKTLEENNKEGKQENLNNI